MSTPRLRALALGLLPLLLAGGCASDPANGSAGSSNGGSGSASGGKSGGGNSGGGSGNGSSSGGSDGNGAGNGGGSTSGGSGGGSSSAGSSGSGSGGDSGSSSGGGSGSGNGGQSGDSGGPALSCGWKSGYTGPPLGRCDAKSCTDGKCGIFVSKGGFLTLDDFEEAPTAWSPAGGIGINWPAQDGRTGAWTQYASTPGKLEVAATDTNGGSPGSKQALHYSGGPGTFEATLALPMGSSCYDASAYDGISFWVKGNAGAGNGKIKFNLHTPVSEPKESGGACTAGCYDHFAKMIDVTPGWTHYQIKWADFARTDCKSPTPPIPDGFEPHKQIVALSFSVGDMNKGFDYWIDDVTFDVAPESRDTFAKILTKPIYDEMFKTAVAPYSYDGFVGAVAKYGSKYGGTFAGERTPLDRKNEVAAFLAHVAHETGSLTLAEETCKCTMPPYYGRGALQLTGQYNYQSAQDAGFDGIVATPAKVLSTADFAFGTAIWFWMTPRSAQGVCHAAILGGDFSQTTRIINGIECGGDPASKQYSRAKLYKAFCAAMGINPHGSLICQ